MTSSPRHRLASLAVLLTSTILVASACAPDASRDDDHGDDHEHESPEPAEVASEALTAGSVEKAARDGCSTGAIKKLSQQIIDEARCIEPDAYVPLPSRPNLTVDPVVFPYLEAPARKKLVEALDANPNKRMTINSMLRTVAQQYMLRKWDLQGRCGIKVASKPGNSNHETASAGWARRTRCTSTTPGPARSITAASTCSRSSGCGTATTRTTRSPRTATTARRPRSA
jgi:hypothetical protein